MIWLTTKNSQLLIKRNGWHLLGVKDTILLIKRNGWHLLGVEDTIIMGIWLLKLRIPKQLVSRHHTSKWSLATKISQKRYHMTVCEGPHKNKLEPSKTNGKNKVLQIRNNFQIH